MQRTILVTVVQNPLLQTEHEIYGRYDPVTLERKGLQVVRSYKQLFTMDDATFAKYGKRKETE